jgi:uncharacterized damage-inducible protein DinB
LSLIDRYRSWFEYEADAHARTLASLDSVPSSARGADYQTGLDLFAHLMVCRRLWLYRIGAVDSGPRTAEDIHPTGSTRGSLDEALAAMIGDWLPYLARLDHTELGRRFEYTAADGSRFSNTVEEILTQLFGHAWHHRGQILSIVRRSGGEPQDADYVFWTRRRLPDAPEPDA